MEHDCYKFAPNLGCLGLAREVLEELVPRLLGAKASQEGDAGNREEEWTPLEGIPAEHVQGLAQDPTSSHFLEVCASHLSMSPNTLNTH